MYVLQQHPAKRSNYVDGTHLAIAKYADKKPSNLVIKNHLIW
jgi:hypothetical protein